MFIGTAARDDKPASEAEDEVRGDDEDRCDASKTLGTGDVSNGEM